MDKDFLKYLDEKHEDIRKKKKISNKDYIDYSRLVSIGVNTSQKFFVAKGIKSRILINHNNIWIDLTDYDIIHIICELEDDVAQRLLEGLIKFYNDKREEFYFKIDEREFCGKGLSYKGYDLEKIISLDCDFEIQFIDFLFVINMILNKDIVGEQYLIKSKKVSLIDRTLMKYISLIMHYKFGYDKAKTYLENIGYPCYEKEELLNKKKKVKVFDKCFESKNKFEKSLLE